mmetsp:Transcript_10258/g.62738  ORF Transcript_10258/g.62738 Transcript_10258/m.62738 type:complete len:267 (+) Transcript_10258:7897-8697(+)
MGPCGLQPIGDLHLSHQSQIVVKDAQHKCFSIILLDQPHPCKAIQERHEVGLVAGSIVYSRCISEAIFPIFHQFHSSFHHFVWENPLHVFFGMFRHPSMPDSIRRIPKAHSVLCWWNLFHPCSHLVKQSVQFHQHFRHVGFVSHFLPFHRAAERRQERHEVTCDFGMQESLQVFPTADPFLRHDEGVFREVERRSFFACPFLHACTTVSTIREVRARVRGAVLSRPWRSGGTHRRDSTRSFLWEWHHSTWTHPRSTTPPTSARISG